MNFQPALAAKVMAGEKTVTRRVVSESPRSPWYRGRCALEVGRTFAVCPGRGKSAIGRARILGVRRELFEPLEISTEEARAEGFVSPSAFWGVWASLHGSFDECTVWRIEFERIP